MRKANTVFFFFCLQIALAQDVRLLHALVVDAQSSEPLAFVTVKYAGGGALTDTSGTFAVPLAPGKSSVEVGLSLVGYGERRVVLQAGAARPTIRLEPADAALGEVVVSGTLKPMARSESPVPIEVYTPKFFRANPAPSLFDGLNIVNGVQPQLNCNVCNTGDIHINGLEGPYTMVLIDGMPIVSALSTVYGLQGIPLSLVERMEVVKGPASTLYGSEAVAGLINIITKDPRRAPRFSLDVNTTTYGETTADVAARVRAGRATGLFAVNAFNFQRRWDVNGDNFTDVTLQRRGTVFGKLAFDRAHNRLASVAARYVWEDRFGGELPWTRQWYGTDSIYGEAIRTNRAELTGAWQLPLREPVFLSYSWNVHDQRSAYGTTLYNARQQVAFAQLHWDKSAGRHGLLVGLATRYTGFDDNTPVTASPDGRENRPSATVLPGVFVQDDITLSKRHRLLTGVRYDYHPVHGSVWSPRANWKWALSDAHTLRFSAGNGYRVANVFSEDHAALTGSRRVVLATDLEPERSWNGNINYTAKFFPGFGFVGFDAAVFYTHFTNRILADYTTDADLIVFDNLDGFAVSRGFTLNTDWNFTNGLKILAGFTAMEVFTEENGERRPQVHAPPFAATWSVNYMIPKLKISVDYTGTVTSPMPLPVVPNDFRPAHSPWFSVQNVQLSRAFGQFEVYAGVKNLLNFLPRDPLLRPFDPFDKRADDPVTNPNGYTFDTTYNYAPLQGRRGFVGVRVQVGGGKLVN